MLRPLSMDQSFLKHHICLQADIGLRSIDLNSFQLYYFLIMNNPYFLLCLSELNKRLHIPSHLQMLPLELDAWLMTDELEVV